MPGEVTVGNLPPLTTLWVVGDTESTKYPHCKES